MVVCFEHFVFMCTYNQLHVCSYILCVIPAVSSIREFLSVGENGDTDDNMVATVPDLTEGSGTLEEDEDRSTLSPHSLTTVGRLKDEADISSLRGERKRLSLQQRTLMHKLGHLNSQSTDLSEVCALRGCVLLAVTVCCCAPQRLQEVFTSGSQKDVLDMLLKTSSLEMHCIIACWHSIHMCASCVLCAYIRACTCSYQ